MSTTQMAMTKEQYEMYRSMSMKMPPAISRRLTRGSSRLHRLKDRYERQQSIVKSKSMVYRPASSAASPNNGTPGPKSSEKNFMWNKPDVIIVNFDEENEIAVKEEDNTSHHLQQVNMIHELFLAALRIGCASAIFRQCHPASPCFVLSTPCGPLTSPVSGAVSRCSLLRGCRRAPGGCR
jgi:hypothetical protein